MRKNDIRKAFKSNLKKHAPNVFVGKDYILNNGIIHTPSGDEKLTENNLEENVNLFWLIFREELYCKIGTIKHTEITEKRGGNNPLGRPKAMEHRVTLGCGLLPENKVYIKKTAEERKISIGKLLDIIIQHYKDTIL